jgi:large subunit ribosomal protein L25
MKLKAVNRQITGKATRRLRREGRLPAVLYGSATKSATIDLDQHEFDRMYSRAGRTQLIDLVVESGRPHKVLIKEVQLSPRRNTVIHVDFHQVSLRERMQVEVPVAVTGQVDPARAGDADVLQVLNTLRVECLPTRIPELIEVDVTDLSEDNPAIRVADVKLPEGVDAATDPEEVIVKLAARRSEIEAEPAEEAAEEAAEAPPTEEG